MMDNLTSPAVVRELAARYGFTFNKSLGQNFITSRSVLNRITEAAKLDRETGVLEIGPGFGALTRELAACAGEVAAVEIDRALIPVLAETLAGAHNVKITCADILSLDILKFCSGAFSLPKLSVCSNLPYSITTDTVVALLRAKIFGKIVLLLQLEAAQRLSARAGSGEYSAASVIVDYYARAEILFNVPGHCFYPRPNVSSAVLSLTPRRELPGQETEQVFLRLVRAAFSKRRKTLQNALFSSGIGTREQIAENIARCGFTPMVRGEALSAQDFTRLAECFIYN